MKKLILLILLTVVLLCTAGCGILGRSLTPESEPPSAPEIVETLPPVRVLTLTVPEGFTLARIGMTLEEMGICTAREFIDIAQTGDFGDFPFVAARAPNPNRCFALEGYLFPDTYEIYVDELPEAIIRRMLANLEWRITPAIREQIDGSGYTFDEILALASIIEKEALGGEAMREISSVLRNRLAAGMRLECDVTIIYVEGAIKPFIEGDINRYNEYYNTYKCLGIPPGAICNPGLEAILAALNPADTDYIFFITDKELNFHFTDDWAVHEANITKYLS